MSSLTTTSIFFLLHRFNFCFLFTRLFIYLFIRITRLIYLFIYLSRSFCCLGCVCLVFLSLPFNFHGVSHWFLRFCLYLRVCLIYLYISPSPSFHCLLISILSIHFFLFLIYFHDSSYRFISSVSFIDLIVYLIHLSFSLSFLIIYLHRLSFPLIYLYCLSHSFILLCVAESHISAERSRRAEQRRRIHLFSSLLILISAARVQKRRRTTLSTEPSLAPEILLTVSNSL